jgi:hypothetical protein
MIPPPLPLCIRLVALVIRIGRKLLALPITFPRTPAKEASTRMLALVTGRKPLTTMNTMFLQGRSFPKLLWKSSFPCKVTIDGVG